MVHQNDGSKLTFFIAEKNQCLVISLIGALSRDSIPVLESCSKKISLSSARWIIVNFRDVPPEMDGGLFTVLACFQKSIRLKPAVLVLCSLHPSLKRTLIQQGIVRPTELTNNVQEALAFISSMEREAA